MRIFATDLDGQAIEFARRGVYPSSAMRSLPADLVEPYFAHRGDDFEIAKSLRAITVFGQHDLAVRAPFPRIDLAMSRNVLIYFTPELQRRALQLFAFSLREGGYLVLGKAESTRPLAEFFSLEEPRLKIYRRLGEKLLVPPARIPRVSQEKPPHPALAGRGGDADRVREPAVATRSAPVDRADGVLLDRSRN